VLIIEDDPPLRAAVAYLSKPYLPDKLERLLQRFAGA
jgi:hypothetical protein